MAKDGYPFVGTIAAAALLSACLSWWYVAAVLTGLGGFVAFFFRDPERFPPADPALLVSPADGKVVRIQPAVADGIGPCRRLSIFLSVFNVHINRLPCDGAIEEIRYRRGKFLAAFNHKASDENEQNTLYIKHGSARLRVTQIAGLIARRIVCWKHPGDSAIRGVRYGLIRFGSRVDVDLPENVQILVKVGDKVQGARTAIARWL